MWIHKVLEANIRNSLRIVSEDHPKVDKELILFAEPSGIVQPFICHRLAENAATVLPWFYHKDNEIESPQQSFFGLYAFRNIMRGILIGARFIEAGDCLCRNGYLASSVLVNYTAAFHLVLSYLASEGRVIVENPMGPITVTANSLDHEELQLESLIARLTRENSWKFEHIRRSHVVRWREFKTAVLLHHEIPDFICTFCNYLMNDALIVQEDADRRAIVEEGIERLVTTRHDSIYQGYGYDDRVHDALLNRESDTGYGIDFKSEAFRAFAYNLMAACLNRYRDISSSVRNDYLTENKVLLAVSVCTPPFEFSDGTIELGGPSKAILESLIHYLGFTLPDG